ncbi:MAG TPA: hypothetical protein VJN18_25665 [Polyangiaceae bacterium]|nr:hypothetical protein [Polyangiaceae bacterium]
MRGSPAKLAKSESFRPAIDVVFSAERLRAIAQATGFALETLPYGLIAGFDLGTLYLAELPGPTAAEARARFEARQILEATKRAPDPNVVVLSGTSAGVPLGLVTIDDRVVAYAVGDPMLCRVVEAYARGKLKAKTAFEGAALVGQAGDSRDFPISAHVPGPFDERWHSAAGGLLGIATSLSGKLAEAGADRVRFELTLDGDFGQSNAVERLRATYMSVAASSTGTLLGLGSSLDPQLFSNEPNDHIVLRVGLKLSDVARGARAAASADLAEIFRLSGSAPTEPNSTPPPTLTPDSR